MEEAVTRPWGEYRVLHRGQGFLVKEIVVFPSQKTSLQRHSHREEVWTIVSGFAFLTVDDRGSFARVGATIRIDAGGVHRIENASDGSDLVIIEVQLGGILSEEDIERLEDDYGRAE